VHVLSRVIKDSQTSGTDLVVAMLLADRAGDDGVCYPGIETLARDARCNERHVRRVVRRLEEKGEIYISSGGGRSRTNLYMVTVGLDADAVAGVLVRRFEMAVADAWATANDIVARQNPDAQDRVSEPQNPDIQSKTRTPRTGNNNTETLTSRAETRTSRAETLSHRPPEPLKNHYEPSVIEGAAAPPPATPPPATPDPPDPDPPAWFEDAASPAPDDPAAAPLTSKSMAEQPVVAMYRDACLRYPSRPQMAWLLAQGIDDLRRWRDVLAIWVSRGWSPVNLAGMVDLYHQPARIQELRSNRPPAASQPSQPRPRLPGAAPIPDDFYEWVAELSQIPDYANPTGGA
jgi:hypothetical protein